MMPDKFRAVTLHAAAQEATRIGQYELASRLLLEAAEHALTPTGRLVLLEKALDAAWRSDTPPRMH